MARIIRTPVGWNASENAEWVTDADGLGREITLDSFNPDDTGGETRETDVEYIQNETGDRMTLHLKQKKLPDNRYTILTNVYGASFVVYHDDEEVKRVTATTDAGDGMYSATFTYAINGESPSLTVIPQEIENITITGLTMVYKDGTEEEIGMRENAPGVYSGAIDILRGDERVPDYLHAHISCYGWVTPERVVSVGVPLVFSAATSESATTVGNLVTAKYDSPRYGNSPFTGVVTLDGKLPFITPNISSFNGRNSETYDILYGYYISSVVFSYKDEQSSFSKQATLEITLNDRGTVEIMTQYYGVKLLKSGAYADELSGLLNVYFGYTQGGTVVRKPGSKSSNADCYYWYIGFKSNELPDSGVTPSGCAAFLDTDDELHYDYSGGTQQYTVSASVATVDETLIPLDASAETYSDTTAYREIDVYEPSFTADISSAGNAFTCTADTSSMAVDVSASENTTLSARYGTATTRITECGGKSSTTRLVQSEAPAPEVVTYYYNFSASVDNNESERQITAKLYRDSGFTNLYATCILNKSNGWKTGFTSTTQNTFYAKIETTNVGSISVEDEYIDLEPFVEKFEEGVSYHGYAENVVSFEGPTGYTVVDAECSTFIFENHNSDGSEGEENRAVMTGCVDSSIFAYINARNVSEQGYSVEQICGDTEWFSAEVYEDGVKFTAKPNFSSVELKARFSVFLNCDNSVKRIVEVTQKGIGSESGFFICAKHSYDDQPYIGYPYIWGNSNSEPYSQDTGLPWASQYPIALEYNRDTNRFQAYSTTYMYSEPVIHVFDMIEGYTGAIAYDYISFYGIYYRKIINQRVYFYRVGYAVDSLRDFSVGISGPGARLFDDTISLVELPPTPMSPAGVRMMIKPNRDEASELQLNFATNARNYAADGGKLVSIDISYEILDTSTQMSVNISLGFIKSINHIYPPGS